MKYTSFSIDTYNVQTNQKVEFDKGYVIKFEDGDLFFLAINTLGPSKKLICDIISQLKIELEDINSFIVVPAGEDNVIYEIYLFPKGVPQNIIQNVIYDIHEKMVELGYYNSNNDNDEKLDDYDDEYEEYCYILNSFAEIPKIPYLSGTIIKDYNNQKYLLTENILHDFLDEVDIPEEYNIVLDDITKLTKIQNK